MNYNTSKNYNKTYNLIQINNEIERQVDKNILLKLTDENLLHEYLQSKSVQRAINKLTTILKDFEIDDNKIMEITNKYILELIPAGTKGVIRGNNFNKIVKNYIENLKLDPKIYEIGFEKNCSDIKTSEIPDWFIKNKTNNKIIIGMNQLDLWGGGEQTNRGSKYLIDCQLNNETTKLLCVICNKIKFKTERSKAFKFFQVGFQNDTLCYLNNLNSILEKFLNN